MGCRGASRSAPTRPLPWHEAENLPNRPHLGGEADPAGRLEEDWALGGPRVSGEAIESAVGISCEKGLTPRHQDQKVFGKKESLPLFSSLRLRVFA